LVKKHCNYYALSEDKKSAPSEDKKSAPSEDKKSAPSEDKKSAPSEDKKSVPIQSKLYHSQWQRPATCHCSYQAEQLSSPL